MKKLTFIPVFLILMILFQVGLSQDKKPDKTGPGKDSILVYSTGDKSKPLAAALYTDSVTLKYFLAGSKAQYTTIYINEFPLGEFSKAGDTGEVSFTVQQKGANYNPGNKPYVMVKLGLGNNKEILLFKNVKLVYRPLSLLFPTGNAENRASLNDNIRVICETNEDLTNQTVFLDCLPIAKLRKNFDFRDNVYSFILENSLNKNDSLAKIFNPGNRKGGVAVRLSIGETLENKIVLSNDFKIIFDNARKSRMIWSTVIFLTIIVLCVFIMMRDGLRVLKDPGTKMDNPPYSLSRSQMAFWTLIVVVSYFIIWFYTGNLIHISPQVLALLGMSAATATVGNIIDRDDIKNPKITKRHQEQNSSGNFLLNILSDQDGVSIHRFQNVVFTFGVGAYFLYEVFHNYNFPELDTNLMLLMGISSGTYLAIKQGENKAYQDTPVG